MLFNSYPFLFVFLPVTLLGYLALARVKVWWAGPLWLTICSFWFYLDWNPWGGLLLGGSILTNYMLSRWLAAAGARAARHGVLALGVVFNLGLLGYFKYADFFLENVNALTGAGLPLLHILLPIGISFFTFQQIAYLADVHAGRGADRNFLRYALFVSFFPQLIAGPIVHHAEMMPQFAAPRRRITLNLVIGFSIFAIGLFKKVVIADTIAAHSSPIFDLVAAGHVPSAGEAWMGALGYGLQIYFDFSGYSDMAIGLARMFGIRLPVNFAAPYRASSIIDFWRRWHITLSRFLRDYLYIPLGGGRRGPLRRWGNIVITMGLGGLWHGASWNFLIWGLMHGAYLGINHGWRHLGGARLPAPLAIGLTLLAVIIAWVPFRAADLETTLVLWQAMAGLGEGSLMAAAGHDADLNNALPQIAAGFLVCLFWPTTQRLMARVRPGLASPGYHCMGGSGFRRLQWRANLASAIVIALLITTGITGLGNVSEFIYFQF